MFLLPACVIYTSFMITPLLGSLRLSLYDSEGIGGALQYVGLDNFRRLFGNPFWSVRFWSALKNNFVFFAIHLVVQNSIGLLLASLLTSSRLRGGELYRTIYFVPTMLSVVIVGFVWRLILSPTWGVTERFFNAFGLGNLFKPWLGLESTALPLLSLISVWQFVGIPMLLFYTALIGIPNELVEAGRVDGASGFRIFWRIRFPLILPVVAIVGILTFIGNFNAFDLIYTTQGVLAGPNFASDILGTLFYRTFFGVQLQLGNPTMGAAIAIAMLTVILAAVVFYLAIRRKIATYEL